MFAKLNLHFKHNISENSFVNKNVIFFRSLHRDVIRTGGVVMTEAKIRAKLNKIFCNLLHVEKLSNPGSK